MRREQGEQSEGRSKSAMGETVCACNTKAQGICGGAARSNSVLVGCSVAAALTAANNSTSAATGRPEWTPADPFFFGDRRAAAFSWEVIAGALGGLGPGPTGKAWGVIGRRRA